MEIGDTMPGVGIGNHDTLRCSEHLKGGAQRFRQPPPDIPGQWTCLACGQERVLLVKTRYFRCGCPNGHDPRIPGPYIGGPMGRVDSCESDLQAQSAPDDQPAPPAGTTQNFPSLCPLAQPMPLRLALFPRFKWDVLIGSFPFCNRL